MERRHRRSVQGEAALFDPDMMVLDEVRVLESLEKVHFTKQLGQSAWAVSRPTLPDVDGVRTERTSLLWRLLGRRVSFALQSVARQ